MFEEAGKKLKAYRTHARHHAMERFSVMAIVLFVILGGLMTTSGVVANRNAANALATTAVYTPKATFSRSGVNFTVEHVYTNDKKTRALVLLKTDNVSKLSIDSSVYKVYLTGMNQDLKQETLPYKPSGGTVVFGNSGFFGFYMVNTTGIPSHIVSVVFRNTKELSDNVNTSGKTLKDYGGDSSFLTYDQARVVFNPGANETEHLAALDGDNEPNVSDLYSEIVVKTEEQKAREKLDETLKAMQLSLHRIDEYTERVKADGVVTIPPPSQIAGDEVEGNDKDGYTLKTNFVFSSGYDFDWRSGNVQDGYLDKLMPERVCGPKGMERIDEKACAAKRKDLTYEKFFATVSDETKLLSVRNDLGLSKISESWKLEDGTPIESLRTGGTASRYAQINSDVQALTNEWQAYAKLKQDYQVNYLGKLLSIEYDMHVVKTRAHINADPQALIVY